MRPCPNFEAIGTQVGQIRISQGERQIGDDLNHNICPKIIKNPVEGLERE